jgi:hypothetical protein
VESFCAEPSGPCEESVSVHFRDLVAAIDAAIAAAVAEEREAADAEFIKLVRDLAAMNGMLDYKFVEAIIEDVEYGVHRIDRLYAQDIAAAVRAKESNKEH